jgi:hypothetical protein
MAHIQCLFVQLQHSCNLKNLATGNNQVRQIIQTIALIVHVASEGWYWMRRKII